MAEPVEKKEITVSVPGETDWYGIVKTTFAQPPYLPELRISILPFLRRFVDSSNKSTTSFILHTHEGALLLAAILRQTADLIDEYANRLPGGAKQ